MKQGDCIQAVGSEDALASLALMLGEREEGELPLENTQAIESLLFDKERYDQQAAGRSELSAKLRLYGNPDSPKRY